MFKILIILITLVPFIITGCGQSEKEILSIKVKQLEAENAILKNTPQGRYAKASDIEKNNKPDEALQEYNEIIKLYPNTDESKNAQLRINAIMQAKQEEKEKEEAKKREYEESIKPPLQLVKAQIVFNVLGYPEAKVIVKNTSSKIVDAYTVSIYCYDNFNNPVKKYNADSNKFGGISQDIINPGQSNGYDGTWTLHGHENTTKIKVVLDKVHMSDNSTWTPQKGQEISVETTK